MTYADSQLALETNKNNCTLKSPFCKCKLVILVNYIEVFELFSAKCPIVLVSTLHIQFLYTFNARVQWRELVDTAVKVEF